MNPPPSHRTVHPVWHGVIHRYAEHLPVTEATPVITLNEGNTPLIRLRRASERTGCEILGKAEFLNPGGSVKDRAALWIIRDAEERGVLRPGGVVVEGTAGNTGIGLALVGNARGYRTVIVMPSTQSQEKKDMLRLCGAELVEVPALPYSNPNNYQHVGRRLAEQLKQREKNGVIFADQWNNLDNRKAHYVSTGPEIWEDSEGKITHLVCGMGTGGTISGVGRYLKEKNPGVKVIGVDPVGSLYYEYVKTGKIGKDHPIVAALPPQATEHCFPAITQWQSRATQPARARRTGLSPRACPGSPGTCWRRPARWPPSTPTGSPICPSGRRSTPFQR